MSRHLFLLAAAASLLSATEYLPLEPGNSWTYRQHGGRNTFTITVGVPVSIGGQNYYRVRGYLAEDRLQSVLVRAGEDGTLYYRDEERDRDLVLTLFEPGNFWFEAPFRPCAQQEGQASRTKEAYEGPAGRFGPSILIRYRSFGCADIGVTEELYVENVGMVRRVLTSIAGPQVYELVHARVGAVTVAEKPNTAFRVTVQRPDATRLVADLRLSTDGGAPLKLQFNSSQEYDVALRDSRGNTLYVWSADKVFLQALHEKLVAGELSYSVEIPLMRPLEPGTYIVEGWITAGPSHREFSASAAFDVTAPPAAAANTKDCGGFRPCETAGIKPRLGHVR